MCNAWRQGARLERASSAQHLMPLMANPDSQNMRIVACTFFCGACCEANGLGKVWRGCMARVHFAVMCVALTHGLVPAKGGR